MRRNSDQWMESDKKTSSEDGGAGGRSRKINKGRSRRRRTIEDVLFLIKLIVFPRDSGELVGDT